ncbi:MAG: hypothetical protein AAFP76_06750 [Bacteroidota bacterium]
MKYFTLSILSLCLSFTLTAQELLSPSFGISKKKTAYITLQDGSELKGNIHDIDRDKGLIEEITVKNGSGKKQKLEPEEIKFMYLPANNLDKLSKTVGTATNAQNWQDDKIDQKLLNKGYVYFELSEVKLKKKTKKLLMQLLNPSFSKNIKVYHDPYAGKTTSLGIGAVKLTGGIEKSYYIAKENATAFRIKKKDYKDEFGPLWSSCPAVTEKFPEKHWRDLTQHILSYNECSE